MLSHCSVKSPSLLVFYAGDSVGNLGESSDLTDFHPGQLLTSGEGWMLLAHGSSLPSLVRGVLRQDQSNQPQSKQILWSRISQRTPPIISSVPWTTEGQEITKWHPIWAIAYIPGGRHINYSITDTRLGTMSKFPDLWKYDGLWIMIYIHTLDWNLPMFWMRAAHGYFLPGQQFLQCRACIVAWSRQWWWRWRPSSLCLGDETPLCHWSVATVLAKNQGPTAEYPAAACILSFCLSNILVLLGW